MQATTFGPYESFLHGLREIEAAVEKVRGMKGGDRYEYLAVACRKAREAVERGERVCVRCWSSLPDAAFAKADAGGFFLDEKAHEEGYVRPRPKDTCDGCIRGFEISQKPRV